MEYIDTFSGNGYTINKGNILPRYYADDKGVCVGTDATGKEVIKDKVKLIFYGLRQIRLNLYEYSTGKKFPKCFSDNFITPTGGEEKQLVESCVECKLKDWEEGVNGERIKPECQEVLDVIAFDIDSKNYCTIQFRSTSKKVWGDIERMAFTSLHRCKSYLNGINPIQQFVFCLKSVQTTTNNMKHAIFDASIFEELHIEHKKKHAIQAQASYKFLLDKRDSQLVLTGEIVEPVTEYTPQPIKAPAPVNPKPLTQPTTQPDFDEPPF